MPQCCWFSRAPRQIECLDILDVSILPSLSTLFSCWPLLCTCSAGSLPVPFTLSQFPASWSPARLSCLLGLVLTSQHDQSTGLPSADTDIGAASEGGVWALQPQPQTTPLHPELKERQIWMCSWSSQEEGSFWGGPRYHVVYSPFSPGGGSCLEGASPRDVISLWPEFLPVLSI